MPDEDHKTSAVPLPPPSVVWGDESEAVAAALEWARARTVRASDPKTTARPPEELAEEVAEEVGEVITPEGIGAQRAMQIFTEILEPATRSQDDPMNLAYIPAAPTRASVAFDEAVASANIFGGLWETGAGAIFAENQVLTWITDMLGWPRSSGGCFVSGGTAGNLSAIAAARESWRTRHGRPEGGFKLACSSTAHSSVRSAARLLDMEVVPIPVDERDHLTGAAVADALASDPSIVAVVASAGSTNAGVVDDIDDVADAAHAHGAWVHVDGAYGGAGLCAPSAQDRFRGVEKVDSFTVDPHKWLFAPYDCCALVYRNPAQALATHSQHAEYLDNAERGKQNPADLAAHLTRRTRGLPLWYSLAVHGTDRYTQAVEMSLSTARAVAAGIKERSFLRLLREPELSIVVFDRPGWDWDDYVTWSNRLARDGVILCVPTRHKGAPALRLAFVNPETKAEHVLAILDSLAGSPDEANASPKHGPAGA
ncbi:pyridoxal phosphate-dependent decarboxylase family protein [Propioniferax innocua]|uniref:pyridoxal phosphate-dependent decarboxylase family protein n=1 Tax=Propioniferax innocua TaxID=1753 RepID=UPI001B85E110|nr:aminotransferase class V-fold PLP-dependent enzyme [Propioniferax innocua]